MLVIGITGGIASGKTSASNYLKSKGCYVFNADYISKEILKNNTTIQKKLLNKFGNEIISNKKINSYKLAQVAFNNKKNQKILNNIFWPEINKKLFQDIKDKKKMFSIYIVDAALIIESKLYTKLDLTLLIISSKKNRMARIIKKNQFNLEQAKKIMNLQLPDNQKKQKADTLILNNGSMNDFYNQLDCFYNKITLKE